MKKTILVTGGAGYIGSHTAVELIRAGYGVVIVDDLSNNDRSALEGIRQITGVQTPFVEADCGDAAAMRKLFADHPVDAVIHFAACKAVGESVHEPLKYYRNNIDSLVVLLEVMCERGVRDIVFSSSCSVYGQPEVLPATEATPRMPAASPYGNTKQICEDILRDGIAAYGTLRGVALRYFNPIGAHPSALIGEKPRGVPSNLVPLITQVAAGVRKELSVFGDDYHTPDGTCLRDYIDIVDLAHAHMAALDRMMQGHGKEAYEVFNVGTGRGVSVLELIRTFEAATGVKVPYRVVERRAGDVEAIWADTSLANRELGWQAETSLAETLLSAWKWEQHLRG